jgi:hypothetical protein
VLFAGAGPQFDETSVIEELDSAISDGLLPSDLLVVYKPHPKRAPRSSERPLDIAKLRNVRLVPPSGPGSVTVGEMPVLLRAVDAIASPFSTMLLEAALCGRPCLAVGYDDPAHAGVKWESVRKHIHVTPLLFAPWALACNQKENMVASVARLMTLVGRADVAERARQDVLHVLYHDGRDFGTRVAEAAIRFLNNANSALGTVQYPAGIPVPADREVATD